LNEKIISPLNRVEGDLDLKVVFQGNKVIEAYPMSRLFRGIEIILKNKYPMDSLVITPRICGICGGSHLMSAVEALDMAYKAEVPPNAVLLRNIMALAEMGQNDVRHTYLMFMIDTVNKKYEKMYFYKDMVTRWAPFYGTSYKAAVKWSKRYTEIYAIFGGQWPHGSSMVPGGVTADPYPNDILKAKGIINEITSEFIEKVMIGGPLDQFLQLKSVKDLDQWSQDYPNGDISKLWTYGREMKWDKIGRGSNFLMSFGHVPSAEDYTPENPKLRFKRGILNLDTMEFSSIDQANMLEFVTKSFYSYSKGDIGLHPFEGETNPLPPFSNDKYTFTKTFRYKLNGKLIAPEVGALSMMAVDNNPLIIDLLNKLDSSVLLREIARFVRLAFISKIVIEELEKFRFGEPTYKKPLDISESKGYGLVEASRGSLGHWIVIKDNKIFNYQVVTPTQINMGPEDSYGNLSHISKALIGTTVEDIENPIELAHIVRSHDACMVCNVHVLDGNREKMVLRL